MDASEEAIERGALLAGALVAVGSLAFLLLSALVAPERGLALLAQSAAQLALGKETGIPAGLRAGTPPVLVALWGVAQDLVILLFGYALVLRAARGAVRSRWLARRLPRRAAKRPRRRTELVGVPLLALSLWIPFLPTGGLVAAVLGRAVGYRARLLLPVLAASVALSHAAYAVVFAAALRVVGGRALLLLTAGVAATVALAAVWRAHRLEPHL